MTPALAPFPLSLTTAPVIGGLCSRLLFAGPSLAILPRERPAEVAREIAEFATSLSQWLSVANSHELKSRLLALRSGSRRCRRVTPRLGRPLPFPTLVWVKIHHVQLARR